MANAAPTENLVPAAQQDMPAGFNPRDISRPDRKLLTYYLLVAACTGPAVLFVLLPLLFKYLTLHYTFDDSGVSMRWGVLFRTEIYLTYRRVQDIHLTRNLLQRWLGLATVSIQTASGSATPEMKIEGILEADALRDYLYSQMRGARHESDPASEGDDAAMTSQDDALLLLTDIRDALQRIAGDTSEPVTAAVASDSPVETNPSIEGSALAETDDASSSEGPQA